MAIGNLHRMEPEKAAKALAEANGVEYVKPEEPKPEEPETPAKEIKKEKKKQ